MTTFLTRLCWNDNGWTCPAGKARLAEGEIRGSAPTFASLNGYGHEEWLFRPEHQLAQENGLWQYAFLQQALKPSDERKGTLADVVLYTIQPDGTRFYLGCIRALHILTDAESERALAAFRQRGWLQQMAQDLHAAGLTTRNVVHPSPRDIVNVRFRPDQVEMLRRPIRAQTGDITLSPGHNRYRFYTLAALPSALSGTSADPALATGRYRYRTSPVVTADHRHNRLQLVLAELIRSKYGTETVSLEVEGVDIRLRINGAETLIEVKSDGDARLAIRAALGQLLEYALFAQASAPMPSLVVAAPGPLDSTGQEYLAELRERFALPIRYVQVDEATTVCPL